MFTMYYIIYSKAACSLSCKRTSEHNYKSLAPINSSGVVPVEIEIVYMKSAYSQTCNVATVIFIPLLYTPVFMFIY